MEWWKRVERESVVSGSVRRGGCLRGGWLLFSFCCVWYGGCAPFGVFVFVNF